MSVGLVLYGGYEEIALPHLCLSFWWVPAIFGISWLVMASLQSLPLSSVSISSVRHVFPSLSLRNFCSPPVRTPAIIFRTHSDHQGWFLYFNTLNLYPLRFVFSNNVTFTGSGNWNVDMYFQLPLINPIQ